MFWLDFQIATFEFWLKHSGTHFFLIFIFYCRLYITIIIYDNIMRQKQHHAILRRIKENFVISVDFAKAPTHSQTLDFGLHRLSSIFCISSQKW